MESERVTGDLPNSGAYAMVHYHKADGEPVSKVKATHATVIEYDKDNKPIAVMSINLEELEDEVDD